METVDPQSEPAQGAAPTCLALVSVSDQRAYRCFAQLAEALERQGIRFVTLEMGLAAASAPTEEGGWLRLPERFLWDAWRGWFRHLTPPPEDNAEFEAVAKSSSLELGRRFQAQSRLLRGSEAAESRILSREWWCLRVWALLLHSCRPAVVLVWNGGSISEAALSAMARHLGSAVLHAERGPLPDTLQVDPMGVNGRSAFAGDRTPAALPALSALQVQELDGYVASLRKAASSAWEQPDRESAAAVRSRLGIPASARVLFFPGQVTNDTNVILNSPYFKGNADVVEFLGRALQDQSDWWLVIKRHPKAEDTIERPDGLGARCVICADVHVHSLIDLSDLVVTINSSVACEAALFGRPVLQLGRSLLSQKGVLHEARGRDECAHLLSELTEGECAPACSDSHRKAFFRHFVFEFLYRFDGEVAGRDAARLATRIAKLGERHQFDPDPAQAFRALSSLLSVRPDGEKLIMALSDVQLREPSVCRRLLRRVRDEDVLGAFWERGLLRRLPASALLRTLARRLPGRLFGARRHRD